MSPRLDRLTAECERLRAALDQLTEKLDLAATYRQAWSDHPEIGDKQHLFARFLRGKRYGYAHAAQLLRAALEQQP